MKLIDLSVVIENTPAEPMKIQIDRVNHQKGAKKIARESHFHAKGNLINKFLIMVSYFLGNRKIRHTDFPEAEFITLDTITMPTHMGTHVDAPIHFGSKCEGKPARAIDEMPLEMFYSRGIRLDLRHKLPGQLISSADIENALNNIEHQLEPKDIVLLWTGAEDKWGTKEYFTSAPGMSEEATAYLVEKGVQVMGIDSYGFDRPFGIMMQEFFKNGDKKALWPSHFYGRKKEYVHIERLTNLASLPDKGFTICCFPLRIKGADASWTRVVALVEEQ